MAKQSQTAAQIDQFLTFRLGEEEFGVQIQRVQGIQGWDTVTRIPQTPPHVLGVIDLRGTVVPIIDLRKRLGFRNCGFGPTTVVVVVTALTGAGERTFGLVVDAVSEVLNVAADDRKERPDFGAGAKAEYMLGLAAPDGRMVILVDLDRLMSDADVSLEIESDAHDGQGDAAPGSRGAIDAQAIEDSFALLAPHADELVSSFYERLLADYPAVRPLFEQTDMPEQKRKLLAAIKLVVSSVRKAESLGPTLRKLGARHQQIGAARAHYGAVADTLLGVMSQMAGDAWTPRVAAAWRAALELVAEGMLEGYSAEAAPVAAA